MRREKMMKLKRILVPSDKGGDSVTVPSLPWCISEGNTKKSLKPDYFDRSNERYPLCMMLKS